MMATLKLFAGLNQFLHAGAKDNTDSIAIGPQSTIATIITDYGIDEKMCHLVLLNGVFVAIDDRTTTQVQDTDVVSIWPPIGGG